MPDADRSLPPAPHHPPPGGRPVPSPTIRPSVPALPTTPAPAASAGADLPTLIDAATRRWEPLAAEAWAGFLRHGRGALLLEAAELLALDAAEGDLLRAGVRPTFVPVTIVHRGDDFRGMLMRMDPERQVMLLVRTEGGEELLMTLDRTGDRPSPADCLAARIAAPPPSHRPAPGDDLP